MRFNHGMIDAHVHGHGGPGVDQFLRNAHDHYLASGLDAECILSVRHGRSGCITDAEALLMKYEMPDWFKIYCNPAWRIEGFDGLLAAYAERIRDYGLILWDDRVPSTLNAATTVCGTISTKSRISSRTTYPVKKSR